MTFEEYCNSLEEKIVSAYEEGVTNDQAERLAAEFLNAQLKVSRQLAVHDLDARMRKSGVKAVKAAVYMEELKKHDKKPTESQLTATIDSHDVVNGEQIRFDEAEVKRDELERLFNVFGNAHIYFRGVAKGNFNV